MLLKGPNYKVFPATALPKLKVKKIKCLCKSNKLPTSSWKIIPLCNSECSAFLYLSSYIGCIPKVWWRHLNSHKLVVFFIISNPWYLWWGGFVFFSTEWISMKLDGRISFFNISRWGIIYYGNFKNLAYLDERYLGACSVQCGPS